MNDTVWIFSIDGNYHEGDNTLEGIKEYITLESEWLTEHQFSMLLEEGVYHFEDYVFELAQYKKVEKCS